MGNLPPWIRARISGDGRSRAVRDLLRTGNLHTVCESARCPNNHECSSRGIATFLMLGNICARRGICSKCLSPRPPRCRVALTRRPGDAKA